MSFIVSSVITKLVLKPIFIVKPVLSLLIAILCFTPICKGQSVDEIIKNAIEKTGGAAKWTNLKGFKIIAKFDQGGVEFPLEIVQLGDGRQYTKLTFQGNEIKQGVFDGMKLWSTNFQTMEPKMSDAETTQNVKLDSNDFPDGLLNYRSKGYKAELEGKTTIDGSEAFKVKLVKEPMTINGKTYDDITYYYFDVNTNLPIAREFEMKHGPIQGSTMVISLGDYQEVQGLLFPFSMSQGVKDAPPQPLKVESIEINPRIDDMEFTYPEK